MFKNPQTLLKILEVFVGIFSGMVLFTPFLLLLIFYQWNVFASFVFAFVCFCIFSFFIVVAKTLIFLLQKHQK